MHSVSGERTRLRVRAAAPRCRELPALRGKTCFGGGAETSTRGACAPRNTCGYSPLERGFEPAFQVGARRAISARSSFVPFSIAPAAGAKRTSEGFAAEPEAQSGAGWRCQRFQLFDKWLPIKSRRGIQAAERRQCWIDVHGFHDVVGRRPGLFLPGHPDHQSRAQGRSFIGSIGWEVPPY